MVLAEEEVTEEILAASTTLVGVMATETETISMAKVAKCLLVVKVGPLLVVLEMDKMGV